MLRRGLERLDIEFLTYSLVGIVGAFIGGALYRLATGADSDTFDDFDLGSFR